MIATWMLYCVAIAAMLGAAAHAVETMLRSYARPARGIWALGMIGSVAVPVAGWLAPRALDASGASTIVSDDPATVAMTDWRHLLAALDSAIALLERLSPLFVGAWIAASAALAVIVVWCCARLERERRGWRRAVVGSVPVLVSRDTGPAVVGFVREDIVLPRWVLALRTDLQTLITRHEEQHVRAGDARLLWSALAVVLLLPWNVALWWQLRRLRLAIEADCDRRVIAAGAEVRAYGSLLIEMGRRASGRPPALAFTPRRSSLARRIELMTWKPRFRLWRTIVAVSFAAALVLAACETPLPPAPDSQSALEGLVDRKQACESVEGPACSSLEPVFVLDGVVIPRRSLFDVEPAEIERIEVVKGTAAAERYGRRAAAGVVSIFTKARLDADSSNAGPVLERAVGLGESLRRTMTKERLHKTQKRRGPRRDRIP